MFCLLEKDDGQGKRELEKYNNIKQKNASPPPMTTEADIRDFIKGHASAIDRRQLGETRTDLSSTLTDLCLKVVSPMVYQDSISTMNSTVVLALNMRMSNDERGDVVETLVKWFDPRVLYMTQIRCRGIPVRQHLISTYVRQVKRSEVGSNCRFPIYRIASEIDDREIKRATTAVDIHGSITLDSQDGELSTVIAAEIREDAVNEFMGDEIRRSEAYISKMIKRTKSRDVGSCFDKSSGFTVLYGSDKRWIPLEVTIWRDGEITEMRATAAERLCDNYRVFTLYADPVGGYGYEVPCSDRPYHYHFQRHLTAVDPIRGETKSQIRWEAKDGTWRYTQTFLNGKPWGEWTIRYWDSTTDKKWTRVGRFWYGIPTNFRGLMMVMCSNLFAPNPFDST